MVPRVSIPYYPIILTLDVVRVAGRPVAVRVVTVVALAAVRVGRVRNTASPGGV